MTEKANFRSTKISRHGNALLLDTEPRRLRHKMRVRIHSKRGHRFEEKIKNFDYSQVDAHSGSILWYNHAESGIGYDLRDPESVAGSLKELLEDFFLD